MPERPLLTAHWRNLLLLNFPVPADVIEHLAPPGTEPDCHDDQAYISIVGFHFENTRLFGVPFPGHTNFLEINLRYYVKRLVGNEIRRGVVFAREIAPRRAVALIANRVYNENYITRPMRTASRIAATELAPGDKIEYAWKSPLPRSEGRGGGFFHAVAEKPLEPNRRPHRRGSHTATHGVARRVLCRALLGLRPWPRQKNQRVPRRTSALACRARRRRYLGLRSCHNLRPTARRIPHFAANERVRRRRLHCPALPRPKSVKLRYGTTIRLPNCRNGCRTHRQSLFRTGRLRLDLRNQ